MTSASFWVEAAHCSGREYGLCVNFLALPPSVFVLGADCLAFLCLGFPISKLAIKLESLLLDCYENSITYYMFCG